MTITIEPDGTGEVRRPVGETTQALPLYTPDSGPTLRLRSSGVSYTERRAFACVGSTGELPFIVDVANRQAANEVPQSAPARTPGHRARHRLTLLGRLRRWIGGTR